MGNVAFRQDAEDQKRFLDYIKKHHHAWMEFADELGRDLSPSDLILVDGCDKTSEWACAAWSEKTQSVMLSFVAGVPGIAQGGAGLWGKWLSAQSLYKNVGPQPLVPAVGAPDPTLHLTPQLSDAMSIDELPSTSTTSRLLPPSPSPPFNQCVFVRGFQMADRTKWYKRKKVRIDVGNGFKTVSRPSGSKHKETKDSTTRGSFQLHSASGGSSESGTSLPGTQSIDPQSGNPQDNVYSDSDDNSPTDIEEVSFHVH